MNDIKITANVFVKKEENKKKNSMIREPRLRPNNKDALMSSMASYIL